MTTPISEFRDIVHLLFRVTHPDAFNSSDLHTLIDKIHDILLRLTPQFLPPFEFMLPPPRQEPPTLVIHSDIEASEVIPNVVVTKEEPEKTSVRNIVINLQSPVVHAVKLEAKECTTTSDVDDETIEATTATATNIAEAADDDTEEDTTAAAADDDMEEDTMAETAETDEEDQEDEEEEEEDEEDEEDGEEEEEEEEEEDEDLELLKIKKQKYYFSPSSKRIYEFLDKGYGDCIGTYVDGKIIPKE